MTRTIHMLATATALVLALTAPANAQTPFFAHKTITISIGYTAGGSYDLYGRLVARHLGKHIPGQPTVVPQNMPGAGSLRAANYVYNIAPKDGTALGIVTQTVALEEALGTPGVPSASSSAKVCVTMPSAVPSLGATLKRKLAALKEPAPGMFSATTLGRPGMKRPIWRATRWP